MRNLLIALGLPLRRRVCTREQARTLLQELHSGYQYLRPEDRGAVMYPLAEAIVTLEENGL